jgi:hypothetical protein
MWPFVHHSRILTHELNWFTLLDYTFALSNYDIKNVVLPLRSSCWALCFETDKAWSGTCE